MQSAVCNRCPLWAKCCLTYGGKACHKAAKEAGFEVKPTNFERIKDMSVEELADFICGIYDDDNAKFINGTIIPCYNHYDIEEWLEREAEE